MNAIDATGPYRRPCGTNEIRPAVILQPSSPRPRSRALRQSTPRTVADAPATLQEVALAIAACPAVPDPNVADPPSHHPPSRCCDNQLNPPTTPPPLPSRIETTFSSDQIRRALSRSCP